MKRLLALFLAFLMVFGLTACSESDFDLAADIITDVILDSIDDSGTSSGTSTAAPSSTASTSTKQTSSAAATTTDEPAIDYDGDYYTVEDVALYIHTYGALPANFITKNEARDLGWEGGSVEKYADGCVIGGDVFQNREGLLPKADGRTYFECDIDTVGRDSRGEKRIVYSNDGLIYYTEDHYETFTLLYGEE